MKSLILFAALLTSTVFSFAQNADASPYADEAPGKISRSAVHLEFGGPGLISTLNFDTRFTGQPDGFGGRIGFGGFLINGSGWFTVPVAFNYLAGNTEKGNYFEVGAGATLIGGDLFPLWDNGMMDFFGHITFGFRAQPPEGGFNFRATVSPIFGSDAESEAFFLPYIPALSFGYSF